MTKTFRALLLLALVATNARADFNLDLPAIPPGASAEILQEQLKATAAKLAELHVGDISRQRRVHEIDEGTIPGTMSLVNIRDQFPEELGDLVRLLTTRLILIQTRLSFFPAPAPESCQFEIGSIRIEAIVRD